MANLEYFVIRRGKRGGGFTLILPDSTGSGQRGHAGEIHVHQEKDGQDQCAAIGQNETVGGHSEIDRRDLFTMALHE